ncbi:MAG: hypothetical protein KUG82_03085 [Pseudomonadales bacterium]|nr:hypothetical protein [Pseudomonadales bacterium]
MKISKLISSQAQRGQGMSEYLIMVGVIAISAIVVFGAFGTVVEEQTANAANLLGGTTIGATTTTVAAPSPSNTMVLQ